MLKVKGFKERKSLEVGDIIAYPEGSLALVVERTEERASVLEKRNRKTWTISLDGQELTFYGNLFEMDFESRKAYLDMQEFKRKKLSGEI
jgi:hypothetical protein